MYLPFQLVYDREYPTLESFRLFLQTCLQKSNLGHLHDAEDIMKKAYGLYFDAGESKAVIIQLARMKSSCMEVIQDIKQTENKKHFNHAVQALFDSDNPESLTFCASIARTLRQYRLSGTYEPKEIIAEAYARGVLKIDQGEIIQIPLAWLRRTCLNVIRDFQRKQTKSDKPKLDGEAYSPGGVAIEHLLWQEDLTAIRAAFRQLNSEEQKILHARIFQGLSWQEIGESEQFFNQDGLSLKPGTARQRGARALQKLRKRYEQIRDEFPGSQADDA